MADAPSAPIGMDGTTETMGSPQAGVAEAFSVPPGRAESDPGAASVSDTGLGNGGDPLVVHTSSAAGEGTGPYL